MNRRLGALALGGAVAVAIAAVPRDAAAQSLPPPDRSAAWDTVSTVAMVVGMSSQVLMPRLYWSDTEVTIGSKARWHASVLGSTMFLLTTAFFNELVVKPEITSYRPGCGVSNVGAPGCTTFGMPSTHTFVAFSALGHGGGVFLVDTLKWSDGRVSGLAIAGDVALPLVAAGLTYAGRVAGTPSQEHGDQALVGAAVGLGFGLLAGGAYALLQRPECPYGAGVICW
ncbi:MAG: hypothetical protein KF764_21135 [Labilithrix sp.]|nr:hypothetical protein [Labilithrix sp.]MBX3222284.1 hypothetical protein [Labilithrix sp.]